MEPFVPKTVKTDEEWLAQLGELAFNVTRRAATERPFTHDDFPVGEGIYRCVCCGAPLFTSAARFHSTCGWPSFTTPVDTVALENHEDNSLGMRRIEVRCRQCDAHLGHVFPDGPAEHGGLRYCINGVALAFDPEAVIRDAGAAGKAD